MSLPRFSGDADPDDGVGGAIRVGESQMGQREQTRWGTILVVFMRALAVLWMAQGLMEWTKILLPGQAVLDQSSPAPLVAAVIFFAIADLLAGVGLWLATPWGGALWLFAAISQIFVVVALPHFYSTLWAVADFVLIVAYFALTWKAGHAADPKRRRA